MVGARLQTAGSAYRRTEETIQTIGQLRAAPRQARHLAEAAALFAVLAAFGALPIDWASAIGGWLGRTVGPRLGISRRAFKNLRRALPGNSDDENRRIVLGMWDNLGRSVAEFPHLEAICAAGSKRVEIVNGEEVASLRDAGQPVILFGGHFANWEVGPSTIHRLFGPSLLSVFRASNNPWADRVLRRRMRTRRAVAKGADGGRDLLRHLRQGGHVAMLVDQKMNDGIAVPFFGHEAMTAPAIARLALRFNCPIVPVRVERLNGTRFRFTVLPRIELADMRDTADNVRATLTRITAVIEDWIVARPEQWLWLHRRWPREAA
ncbi:MAG TPA: lauroyl acyltransferase [Stellaceae bacterium]|nr:lauroyl acyltransferase [Stellaceae bacterium]